MQKKTKSFCSVCNTDTVNIDAHLLHRPRIHFCLSNRNLISGEEFRALQDIKRRGIWQERRLKAKNAIKRFFGKLFFYAKTN